MGWPKGRPRKVREKPRVSETAERALRIAIEQETSAVNAQLATAQRRIAELEAALAQISRQALAAIGAMMRDARPFKPVELPKIEEPEIPSAPAGDLDDNDHMGPGRWV